MGNDNTPGGNGPQDDPRDDEFFDYGDIVYLRLNPELTGMIVGEADFGRRYQVRLLATLGITEFQYFEIAHVEPDGGDGGAEIIDFTKAAASLKDAKTRGAA